MGRAIVNFSEALIALRKGLSVYREGWNGVKYGVKMSVFAQIPDENSKMSSPYLVMNVDGNLTPWTPSQSDLFSEDWVVGE